MKVLERQIPENLLDMNRKALDMGLNLVQGQEI